MYWSDCTEMDDFMENMELGQAWKLNRVWKGTIVINSRQGGTQLQRSKYKKYIKK